MTYKTPNTPFSTRMSGGAKETRLRLRSIFQWKKKRPPVVFFVLAAVVALSCGGLVAFRMDDRSETVFPQIAMAVQYYDAYENYIEIPVLVTSGGQEEDDGISAINSAVYVSFEAESAYPGALTGYLPVSYVKDGEQRLTGSFRGYDAIADAVADMPAADSLARIGAVATNGMWDLFPVEVNHETYTMETQPAQEDWYRYFEEKLADLDAADTPVIITEAWVFVWDGVKTAVANAGNVLLSGDDTVRRGAAHIPLNPPVGENAIMYQISALFREGNEPIDLIYAETAQVSYRPPQDEVWQHIFSAVQYDARGSLTVCPVFTDFTGELATRGFRYSPAQYVVCDVDGDGVVELLQGCDGSSSLTSRYSVYKLNGGTPEVVFSLAG